VLGELEHGALAERALRDGNHVKRVLDRDDDARGCCGNVLCLLCRV
jgi:hypothetical protein